MYEFFQLLCAEDINLTDFQNFYYDYVSEIKSINLTYLKPAKTYKAHEMIADFFPAAYSRSVASVKIHT